MPNDNQTEDLQKQRVSQILHTEPRVATELTADYQTPDYSYYNTEQTVKDNTLIAKALSISGIESYGLSMDDRIRLKNIRDRNASHILVNQQKFSGDSEEMQNVKKSVTELEELLHGGSIEAGGLNAVEEAYERAINACSYYRDHKNPWFPTGKERKRQVVEKLDSLRNEFSLFQLGRRELADTDGESQITKPMELLDIGRRAEAKYLGEQSVVVPETHDFAIYKGRNRMENREDLSVELQEKEEMSLAVRKKLSAKCREMVNEGEKTPSEIRIKYPDAGVAFQTLISEVTKLRLYSDADIVAAIPKLYDLKNMDAQALPMVEQMDEVQYRKYEQAGNIICYFQARVELILHPGYAERTLNQLRSIYNDKDKPEKLQNTEERQLAALMKKCDDNLLEVKKTGHIIAYSDKDFMQRDMLDRTAAREHAQKVAELKSRAREEEENAVKQIEATRIERRIGELKDFLKRKGYQVPTDETAHAMLEKVEKALKDSRPSELTLDKVDFSVILIDQSTADRFREEAERKIAEEENPEFAYRDRKETNEFTEVFNDLYADLRSLKNEGDMGGQPHYLSGDPDFDRSTLHKRIWGMQYNMLEAYWRKKVRTASNSFMKGFWTVCAKCVGIQNVSEESETKYERIFKAAKSLEMLASYKTVIQEAFFEDADRQDAELEEKKRQNTEFQRVAERRRRTDLSPEEKSEVQRRYTELLEAMKPEVYAKYDRGNLLLGRLTQMGGHEGTNGGRSEGENIGQMLFLMKEKYLKAKEYGDLAGFFTHLDGACFDDRVRMLMDYQPVDRRRRETEIFPDPGDDSLWIKTSDQLPEITSEDNILSAISKHQEALFIANSYYTDEEGRVRADAPLNWEDIEPHLKRHLLGKTVMMVDEQGSDLGITGEVTEENLNAAHDIMVNLCMLDS